MYVWIYMYWCIARRELETEAKLLLQKREEEILKQSEQMKQACILLHHRKLHVAIIRNNLITGATCAERTTAIQCRALTS